MLAIGRAWRIFAALEPSQWQAHFAAAEPSHWQAHAKQLRPTHGQVRLHDVLHVKEKSRISYFSPGEFIQCWNSPGENSSII